MYVCVSLSLSRARVLLELAVSPLILVISARVCARCDVSAVGGARRVVCSQTPALLCVFTSRDANHQRLMRLCTDVASTEAPVGRGLRRQDRGQGDQESKL